MRLGLRMAKTMVQPNACLADCSTSDRPKRRQRTNLRRPWPDFGRPARAAAAAALRHGRDRAARHRDDPHRDRRQASGRSRLTWPGCAREFVAEWTEGPLPADNVLSVFQILLPADVREADLVWSLDMMQELQVQQHNMCSCSVTSLGDMLFVNTSNGVDESDSEVASPDAPSFLALNKHTGAILWTDKSPGENILHGQWSSPAAGVLGGVPQVIFAGGDGWVYSFRADAGKDGKPELLWKFDTNPKESKWVVGGTGHA